MKKIQLGGRRGKPVRGYATVDDEDYDSINSFLWYLDTHGYAFRNNRDGEPRHVSMHRQITGAKKGFDVDHINRNRLDNRKRNLRVCDRSLNVHNTSLRKNTASGIKGVTYYSPTGMWRVRLIYKGVVRLCRYLKTKEEAGKLYIEASKQLIKELKDEKQTK